MRRLMNAPVFVGASIAWSEPPLPSWLWRTTKTGRDTLGAHDRGSPMRRESRGVKRDDEGTGRRDDIVRAATAVFAKLGFAGASLRVLAAAAGMEKGHLTYYFPTKESLLFEIVNDLHHRFLDGVRQWRSAPVEGDLLLLQVFENHLRFVFDFAAPTRVAYDNFRFLTGARRSKILRQRREYEHELGALIDSCRDSSTIASTPTRILTKVVLAQLNWPYQWYSQRGQLSRDDLERMLAERALASLRPVAWLRPA